MAATFVNTNTPLTATSGTSLSGAQTVSAGSNLGAVVSVYWQATPAADITVTGTLGGAALTAVSARLEFGTDSFFCQTFQRVAPTTGTPTLAMTFSAAISAAVAVVNVYSGIDQTTPVRAGSYVSFNGSNGAAPGSAQVVVPSVVGDRSYSTLVWADTDSVSNQTERVGNISAGGAAGLSTDDGPGAATVTHTWVGFFGGAQTLLEGFSIAAMATGFSLVCTGDSYAVTGSDVTLLQIAPLTWLRVGR